MGWMNEQVAARAKVVEERFTKLCTDIGGVLIGFPPVETWRATQTGGGPEGVFNEKMGGEFGWIWPIHVDDANLTPEQNQGCVFTIGVCPEIVADMSQMLSDDDFGDYLDAIEMMIALDLGFYLEITDWQERRRAVHQHMAENFPGTLSTIAEVELAATFGQMT